MISEQMKILKQEYGFDTVEVRKECLRLAGKIKGNNILDIATGSGWMAIVLGKSGYKVTSIDINKEAIKRAKERAVDEGLIIDENISFKIADAQNLPFNNNTFDAVFSFDSMHHMPECDKVIKELSRVCKPGGVIIISDLNEKGLDAVRSVVKRGGEDHYENECIVDFIGGLLKKYFSDMQTFKLGFVTIYKIINHKEDEL